MNLPQHLLLIDDDADDRDFFVEAITDINPNITFELFPDGSSALANLENANNRLPDYIFLDLRLPALDSKSILKKIKTNIRTANIPVIIFTVSNDEREAEEMGKLGATHFTTKPVNRKELYYVLSMVLESKW